MKIPRGYLQITTHPNSLAFIIHFIALLGNSIFMFITNSWSLTCLHSYCVMLIYFATQTSPSLLTRFFSESYPLCGLSMFFLPSFLPDFISKAFYRSAVFPELSKLELNPSGHLTPFIQGKEENFLKS